MAILGVRPAGASGNSWETIIGSSVLSRVAWKSIPGSIRSLRLVSNFECPTEHQVHHNECLTSKVESQEDGGIGKSYVFSRAKMNTN
jgi:hypothetical protein